MKKVFLMFVGAVVLSTAAHAYDLKVSPVLRMKLTSDFELERTGHDFEISGIKFEKEVTDNLSVAVMPGFMGNPTGIATFGDRQELDFFLIEGYFHIADLTRTYGDWGIALTAGQFITPFHKMEQYYHPYMFVMRPLDFRVMQANYGELGVMLSNSLFDDMIVAHLVYSSGAGIWAPVVRNNVGAMILTASFFPFKTMSEVISDLSLTFNIKSVFHSDLMSNYNLLLGYKYDFISASLEYMGTYSNMGNEITAVSFGMGADLIGPFQLIGRWDYVDDETGTAGTASRYDHTVMAGINTKWFDDTLQVAATYGASWNPELDNDKLTANRIMLAAQFSY